MTEELLTKKESYMIGLFLAKFNDEALEVLECQTYDEFYKLAPKLTNWDVQDGSFNYLKSKMSRRLNGEQGLNADSLADEIVANYGEYDFNEFQTFIDKYLQLKHNQSLEQESENNSNSKLTDNDLYTVLLSLAKFKDETVTAFNSIKDLNCIHDTDVYHFLEPFSSIVSPTMGSRKNFFGILLRHEPHKKTNKLVKKLYSQHGDENFDFFLPYINRAKELAGSYNNEQEELKTEGLNKPYNRIIYGAPGTGKSFLLNTECERYFAQTNYTRVTFYDGYTYGQFVGAYKPVPNGDHVTYKYVAGIFMKILVKALKKPEENFCLIIEEINRARADKVFGNIFQLLDRKPNGESQYEIELSEEQQIYLDNTLDEEQRSLIGNNQLRIPSNLYLWATMNSADQGVYPLDSAFKRRWHFEHLGLNANQDKFGDKKHEYIIQVDNKSIPWNTFRTTINDKLSQEKIFEDRLMAPFFINPSDFDDNHVLTNDVFTDKILMYLFDDILKYKDTKILFNPKCNTFSQLKEYYTQGKTIFECTFEEKSSSVDIKESIITENDE